MRAKMPQRKRFSDTTSSKVSMSYMDMLDRLWDHLPPDDSRIPLHPFGNPGYLGVDNSTTIRSKASGSNGSETTLSIPAVPVPSEVTPSTHTLPIISNESACPRCHG